MTVYEYDMACGCSLQGRDGVHIADAHGSTHPAIVWTLTWAGSSQGVLRMFRYIQELGESSRALNVPVD